MEMQRTAQNEDEATAKEQRHSDYNGKMASNGIHSKPLYRLNAKNFSTKNKVERREKEKARKQKKNGKDEGPQGKRRTENKGIEQAEKDAIRIQAAKTNRFLEKYPNKC